MIYIKLSNQFLILISQFNNYNNPEFKKMDDQFDQWQQAQITQPTQPETSTTPTAIPTSNTNIQEGTNQSTHSDVVENPDANSNKDINVDHANTNSNAGTNININMNLQQEKYQSKNLQYPLKDADKGDWSLNVGGIAMDGDHRNRGQQDFVYQTSIVQKNALAHNTIEYIQSNTDPLSLNNLQQISPTTKTNPEPQKIEAQQADPVDSPNNPSMNNQNDHAIQPTQINNNTHAGIQLNTNTISFNNNFNNIDIKVNTQNIVQSYRSLELGGYSEGDWAYGVDLVNSQPNLAINRDEGTHANINIHDGHQSKNNERDKQQQQDQWQQAFVQATPTTPYQQTNPTTSSNKQIDVTPTYTNPDQPAHYQSNDVNTVVENNINSKAQIQGEQLGGSVHDVSDSNNQVEKVNNVIEANENGDGDDDQFGDYEENQSVVIQQNHTTQNPNHVPINNSNNNNILANQPSQPQSKSSQQDPPLQSQASPLSHSQIQSESHIQSQSKVQAQSQAQSLSQSQAQIQQTSSPVTPITQYQPYKRPQIKVQKPIYTEEDIAAANKLIQSIPDYSFIRATAFIGS